MTDQNGPVLLFDYPFHDLETPAKGYFGGAKVRLADGNLYAVFFYDSVRLAQDLESVTCIAEVGMIVLKKVTLENMQKAVDQLALEGYFSSLKPLR